MDTLTTLRSNPDGAELFVEQVKVCEAKEGTVITIV